MCLIYSGKNKIKRLYERLSNLSSSLHYKLFTDWIQILHKQSMYRIHFGKKALGCVSKRLLKQDRLLWLYPKVYRFTFVIPKNMESFKTNFGGEKNQFSLKYFDFKFPPFYFGTTT